MWQVNTYCLANAAGISWPIPEDLDDRTLERLLMRQGPCKEPTFAEPDHAHTHQELKKKGVTLMLHFEPPVCTMIGRPRKIHFYVRQ